MKPLDYKGPLGDVTLTIYRVLPEYDQNNEALDFQLGDALRTLSWSRATYAQVLAVMESASFPSPFLYWNDADTLPASIVPDPSTHTARMKRTAQWPSGTVYYPTDLLEPAHGELDPALALGVTQYLALNQPRRRGEQFNNKMDGDHPHTLPLKSSPRVVCGWQTLLTSPAEDGEPYGWGLAVRELVIHPHLQSRLPGGRQRVSFEISLHHAGILNHKELINIGTSFASSRGALPAEFDPVGGAFESDIWRLEGDDIVAHFTAIQLGFNPNRTFHRWP